MTTTNSNMGLGDSPREGSATDFLLSPTGGVDIPIVAKARHEITIQRILRRTQDGDCDITFYINSQIVELDDAQPDGSIVADEGALDESIPDGSAVANYTIPEGGRLSYVVNNASSTVIGLEIQVDWQKTITPGNDA